jgi:hypothetical protein
MSYFQDCSLSASTIRAFEPRIRAWVALVPYQKIEYIIFNPIEAIDLLVTHFKKREKAEKKAVCTYNNLRNYISAILAILRHAPHVASTMTDRPEYITIWSDILMEASKPMDDRRNQQIPTVIQSKKGGSKLTYAQIVERRDKGDLEMYAHLLLSMYTYIYPVRADYYATELVREGKEPTTPNYILLKEDSAELIIQDFKTARRYKVIHYPQLPDELYRILIRSLETTPRTYLFEKPNGKPYTRNTFSRWASDVLHSIFGVELTLTLIRHHFVTTLPMDVPVAELERIGALMGHSLEEQQQYRWVSADKM